MKKIIVTTTINPPTEAIRKFDALPGWELIVVGDLKTPEDYFLERGTYISPSMQEKYDRDLSDVIGWNCIQRRNFGFLWCEERNADIVAVVDDDNIPFHGWGENLFLGKEVEVDYYEIDEAAFDPVGATNHRQIWHRGFPLQLLSHRDYSTKKRQTVVPDVQADFWNGDPDVDALCRMEHAPECMFEEKYFPMSSNKLAPFNSQNTFISGKLLHEYFLFPHVGRMDDIWASYYLQAKTGAKVVYGKPSVYQMRNPHDLVKDMKQEYLGYENNLRIVNELPSDPDAIWKYVPEESRRAFDLYRRHF